MKQIINGKMYDTENATHIAETGFGYLGDFGHWNETLCRSPNDQYFLAGLGGPKTKYGIQTDTNTWSGGERITLLSKKEALEWCEECDIDADVIAKEFDIEEG